MQNSESEQPEINDEQVDTPMAEEGNQEEAEPDTTGEQLAAEQKKSAEYLDLLQRTQADFINFKRRARQEQTETRSSAQAALLEQLLPVLDDMGRVLTSAPPELSDHPWAQGVTLSARQLSNTLEQLGLQTLGVPGESFDPYKHEAMMQMASNDFPAGTIAQVVRPGYVMGERVVRPAQVIVSTGPEQVEES